MTIVIEMIDKEIFAPFKCRSAPEAREPRPRYGIVKHGPVFKNATVFPRQRVADSFYNLIPFPGQRRALVVERQPILAAPVMLGTQA